MIRRILPSLTSLLTDSMLCSELMSRSHTGYHCVAERHSSSGVAPVGYLIPRASNSSCIGTRNSWRPVTTLWRNRMLSQRKCSISSVVAYTSRQFFLCSFLSFIVYSFYCCKVKDNIVRNQAIADKLVYYRDTTFLGISVYISSAGHIKWPHSY